MKLSRKSRRAVTAMLDLAAKNNEGPVTLSDISGWQGISVSYLEELFALLRRAELVEGVKGPGGGYRLSKPPDTISIAQIIAAVDESIVSIQYRNSEPCQTADRCMTRRLWEDLSFRLHEFLDGITLADFINGAEISNISIQDNSTSSQISRMFQPAGKVS